MAAPTLVVHVDGDAFFASVAVREDPSLAGLPVAVAVPDGIVACATYVARGFGVRAAMSTRDALRLCPQLVTVPIDADAYERASADLFAVLRSVARTVEVGGVEEAFLAVPALGWDGIEVAAAALRQRICHEARLPVTMGVARTKMMAKLASRAAKPDGLRVVTPDEERGLRPALRVEELWGVGGVTLERLTARGVATVADLGRLGLDELCTVAGTAMGRRLHQIALGTDDAVVRERGPRTSVGSETALPERSAAALDAALVSLAARVAGRMRAASLLGGRVTVAPRRETTGPSAVLDVPTSEASELLATARLLARRLDAQHVDGVRLVVSRLSPASAAEQPALFGL